MGMVEGQEWEGKIKLKLEGDTLLLTGPDSVWLG